MQNKKTEKRNKSKNQSYQLKASVAQLDRAVPNKGREVFEFLNKKADELGLQVTLYNSARYFINNEQDFINYDFIPYTYSSLGKVEGEELQKTTD